MNLGKKAISVLNTLSLPIRTNATFFVFMYILGVVCSWATTGKGTPVYSNLYLELFLDLYVVCAILAVIPHKVRFWLRGLLYVILYFTALADVYCYVSFDSTLTPSMLMLVGETDGREASEFLSTLVSPSVIFSNVGWILLLIIVHIAANLLYKYHKLPKPKLNPSLNVSAYMGVVCAGLLVWSIISSRHNKAGCWKLMTDTTVGEVEHTLTENNHGQMYLPIYRLLFSARTNALASQQIDKLIEATGNVRVDSVSYRSPNIVLIIGESYGRHHSQQYGYFMPTTPRQRKLEKSGRLVKFTDVITCWNLTSFVFKNVFSMHVVGQKGEWCDYPLFPELFRKAGYDVTFLTNQFVPKGKEAVFDFSGGFFLNKPELDSAQFDHRNTSLHRYDSGLLEDYDSLIAHKIINLGKVSSPDLGRKGEANLIIFHLLGQHVSYRDRYPRQQTHFWASSYESKRPELNDRQRKVLSQYDNATLYNDSIVDQIVKRFQKENVIVIYMPDHGEECYEGNRNFICRLHSAAIDYDLAHYEFEIPFWIYCSPSYIRQHPDIYHEISLARNRRFMTDALPHMLLYLAGISAPDYHDEYNLLSPKYDESRKRILKGTTDYDKLHTTVDTH